MVMPDLQKKTSEKTSGLPESSAGPKRKRFILSSCRELYQTQITEIVKAQDPYCSNKEIGKLWEKAAEEFSNFLEEEDEGVYSAVKGPSLKEYFEKKMFVKYLRKHHKKEPTGAGEGGSDVDSDSDEEDPSTDKNINLLEIKEARDEWDYANAISTTGGGNKRKFFTPDKTFSLDEGEDNTSSGNENTCKLVKPKREKLLAEAIGNAVASLGTTLTQVFEKDSKMRKEEKENEIEVRKMEIELRREEMEIRKEKHNNEMELRKMEIEASRAKDENMMKQFSDIIALLADKMKS